MIRKIKLENFQIHSNFQAGFKKGLNVIVGASDCGKTAIFRAFDFCLYNGAKKSNIVKNGEKTAKITVVINKHTIIRERSKSKNLYLVDDMLLKAFGASVPEEVTSVTNLNKINIQKQLDSPFLISESPGAVARYLNELINIDIIDRMLSSLLSKQSSCSKKAGFLNEEYKGIKQRSFEIKEVLFPAKSSYLRIKKQCDFLDSQQTKYDEISTIVEKLRTHTEERKLFLICPRIRKMLSQKQNIEILEINKKKIFKILKSIPKKISFDEQKIKIMVEQNKGIKLKKTKLDNIVDIIENLRINKNIKVLNALKNINNELNKAKKKLKNKCPTCGQIIKKEN